MNLEKIKVSRGDVFLVDFDPSRGSEIQKVRPAIIVTNDAANFYSRVLMAIPLTSQKLDKIHPHEVFIGKQKGLTKESKAKVSQMRAIDKSRLKSKLGNISSTQMSELNFAIKLHLGLD